MSEIRLRVTATREYVANPEHYDDGMTPEQMAQADAGCDPWLILDHHDTVVTVSVVDDRRAPEPAGQTAAEAHANTYSHSSVIPAPDSTADELVALLPRLDDLSECLCTEVAKVGVGTGVDAGRDVHDAATLLRRLSHRAGDFRWRLTMRSGVSSMNDNVIGYFADYGMARFVGNKVFNADRNDHPEYRTFDVEAPSAPVAGSGE